MSTLVVIPPSIQLDEQPMRLPAAKEIVVDARIVCPEINLWAVISVSSKCFAVSGTNIVPKKRAIVTGVTNS